MQMMYGTAMDLTNPELTEENRDGLRRAEKLKMDLWKGPGSFDVDIGDPQFPKLHVFPYVFIEELNDEVLAQAMERSTAKVPEAAKSQALEHLEQTLKTTDHGAGHSEETRQALDVFFDADSAGFLMGSLIGGGFEQAGKVPGSRFLVLDAQKTGNVFYLHVQNVFAASGERPEIRWDREYIWLGCKKKFANSDVYSLVTEFSIYRSVVDQCLACRPESSPRSLIGSSSHASLAQ